jgi:hypothetical protein
VVTLAILVASLAPGLCGDNSCVIVDGGEYIFSLAARDWPGKGE